MSLAGGLGLGPEFLRARRALSFAPRRRSVWSMLVGRSSEEQRLDSLLDQARSGRSSALVLRGVAGVGKTALLEYAASRAGDFRVVRALGVESEGEIAFAGLQQRLTPIASAFGELPHPQARALGTALGLRDGPPPDRLAIAAATLSLLAATVGDSPLLC